MPMLPTDTELHYEDGHRLRDYPERASIEQLRNNLELGNPPTMIPFRPMMQSINIEMCTREEYRDGKESLSRVA